MNVKLLSHRLTRAKSSKLPSLNITPIIIPKAARNAAHTENLPINIRLMESDIARHEIDGQSCRVATRLAALDADDGTTISVGDVWTIGYAEIIWCSLVWPVGGHEGCEALLRECEFSGETSLKVRNCKAGSKGREEVE